MAIVKQISFKEKERELFEYANKRGNFSEYIKRLILSEMNERISKPIIGIPTEQHNEETAAGASDFILEAERDDLEL